MRQMKFSVYTRLLALALALSAAAPALAQNGKGSVGGGGFHGPVLPTTPGVQSKALLGNLGAMLPYLGENLGNAQALINHLSPMIQNSDGTLGAQAQRQAATVVLQALVERDPKRVQALGEQLEKIAVSRDEMQTARNLVTLARSFTSDVRSNDGVVRSALLLLQEKLAQVPHDSQRHLSEFYRDGKSKNFTVDGSPVRVPLRDGLGSRAMRPLPKDAGGLRASPSEAPGGTRDYPFARLADELRNQGDVIRLQNRYWLQVHQELKGLGLVDKDGEFRRPGWWTTHLSKAQVVEAVGEAVRRAHWSMFWDSHGRPSHRQAMDHSKDMGAAFVRLVERGVPAEGLKWTFFGRPLFGAEADPLSIIDKASVAFVLATWHSPDMETALRTVPGLVAPLGGEAPRTGGSADTRRPGPRSGESGSVATIIPAVVTAAGLVSLMGMYSPAFGLAFILGSLFMTALASSYLGVASGAHLADWADFRKLVGVGGALAAAILLFGSAGLAPVVVAISAGVSVGAFIGSRRVASFLSGQVLSAVSRRPGARSHERGSAYFTVPLVLTAGILAGLLYTFSPAVGNAFLVGALALTAGGAAHVAVAAKLGLEDMSDFYKLAGLGAVLAVVTAWGGTVGLAAVVATAILAPVAGAMSGLMRGTPPPT